MSEDAQFTYCGPMWNEFSIQKTLGYPNAPSSIYPRKNHPYPDRRHHNDSLYPKWVPLLTADDIVYAVADSRVHEGDNTITGWVERVFLAPYGYSCTEEVSSYFIAACHELGFPAFRHSAWLDAVTCELGDRYQLSLEQMAAAWNHAMGKLGYGYEEDRTAKQWESEYDKTPARLWHERCPKNKDKPERFQKRRKRTVRRTDRLFRKM